MSVIIAVGGPKGVGKTTVLEQAINQLPEWQLIKVSAELLRLTDNSWSNLSIGRKDEMRQLFAQELLKNLPNKLLLDLHYVDLREGAEKCIQPAELINKCTHFIVFLALPELILKRREKREKDRSKELSLVQIREEIIAELNMARKLAEESKKTYFVFDRSSSEINESVKEFIKFLHEINLK